MSTRATRPFTGLSDNTSTEAGHAGVSRVDRERKEGKGIDGQEVYER